MKDFVNFYGGIASIIGLFIVLVTICYKLVVRYRKTKAETERRFQEQMDRYNAASGTLGARTDLGFFLLNVVGQFRCIALRSYITISAFLLCFFVFVILREVSTTLFKECVALFGMLVTNGALILYVIFYIKYSHIEEHYNNLLNELWDVPIQKHVERQTKSKVDDGPEQTKS